MFTAQAIQCFKTYLILGPDYKGTNPFPRELTRKILNYGYYERWMKVVDQLAIMFKKPNFITKSDLWKNNSSLDEARKWLKAPVKPHIDEIDIFYKETINPMIHFLATCTLVDKDENTFLIWAATNGYAETVSAVVAIPGVAVNAQSESGSTALMWAAWNGHIEVVKVLLAVPGIEPDAVDDEGITALMWGAAHTEIVNLIREHLAEPQPKNLKKPSIF